MRGLKITQNELLDGIRKAYAEPCIDLRTGPVQETKYRRLYRGSHYYFPTWRDALSAAGYSYADVENKAKEAAKLDFLGKLAHAYGTTDLGTCAIRRGDNPNRHLYHRAKFFYGRKDSFWRRALIDAGLPADDILHIVKPHETEALVTKIRDLRSSVSLNATDLQNDGNNAKYYDAIMQRRETHGRTVGQYATWPEFLERIGIDSGPYVRHGDWKRGRRVLSQLRTKFSSGIVTCAGNDMRLRAAAERYFGDVPSAVKKAGLIYCRNGKLTKKRLSDPEVCNILRKRNKRFLGEVVDNVLNEYRAYTDRRSGMSRTTLLDDAFSVFIELLPKKPTERDVRDFSYWRIYCALVNKHRDAFRIAMDRSYTLNHPNESEQESAPTDEIPYKGTITDEETRKLIERFEADLD